MNVIQKALLSIGFVAVASTANAAVITDTQALSGNNITYSINQYTHSAIAGTFSSASLAFTAFDVDSLDGEVDEVWAKKGTTWTFLGNLEGLDDQNSTTTFSLDSSWNASINSGLKVRFLVDTTEAGWYVTPQSSLLSVTTAVPEPETYAMMLAGLGAIGFMARRRKAQ